MRELEVERRWIRYDYGRENLLSSNQAQFSEISPSEFFYRNRDLAGFSNPARSLYSAMREFIENSLDACESIGILPNIEVTINPLNSEESDPKSYLFTIEDNGSGLLPENVPLAFGRVFYGSKYILKQARGMFGLGGTMAILYGQITTNKPVKISSSSDGEISHEYRMMIDIQNNSPIILNREENRTKVKRGTKIEVSLLGDWFRSAHKIHEYFRETAVVNPHAQITYRDPKGIVREFKRATKSIPSSPTETKPHPYGVDVETIRRLLRPERTRMIDSSQEVIRNMIQRELSIPLGRVISSRNLVYKIITNNEQNRSKNKRKIWTQEQISKDFNEEFSNSNNKPNGVEDLGIILKKWHDLSKTVKNFLSLMYQTTLDTKEAISVTVNNLDLVNFRVITANNDINDQGMKINCIQPFHDHLLKNFGGDTMIKFMSKNLHRVGRNNAENFLIFAKLDRERRIRTLTNDDLVSFVASLHRFKDFLMPNAQCLSPLGEEILETGIEKELQPEFISVIQRPASAYSGFPFIAEVGVAYGGKILSQGLKLLRFANRIPLLYDEGNDISWKILNEEVDWKRYKIPQDAPLAIITHVCSTKIPYKTVGKEYLADRPELEREIKNGVREVLRKLGMYLSRKDSMAMEKRKMNIYGKYLPIVARFSAELCQEDRLPQYKSLIVSDEKLDMPSQIEEGIRESKEKSIIERQKTLEDYD